MSYRNFNTGTRTPKSPRSENLCVSAVCERVSAVCVVTVVCACVRVLCVEAWVVQGVLNSQILKLRHIFNLLPSI
jgi:hypothetical protein